MGHRGHPMQNGFGSRSYSRKCVTPDGAVATLLYTSEWPSSGQTEETERADLPVDGLGEAVK